MNEFERVRAYLSTDLQDRICAAIEVADGRARFQEDLWQRAEGAAVAAPACCAMARCSSRPASAFPADVAGSRLPPSASANRPELAGALVARHRGVAGVSPAQSLCANHPRQRALLPGAASMAKWWPAGSVAAST